MNPTENKAIIYDDTCPLCKWYTHKFIQFGMLKKENRLSFSELNETGIITQVEMPRGKHEIPLIDLNGGETIYGIDSLVFILKQKMPFIGTVMKFPPVYSFFKALYSMVSYNRRVIVAAPASECGIDCTPDFSKKYRFIFLVFAGVVATLISYLFGQAVHFLIPEPFLKNAGLDMLVMVGMGWMVQAALAAVVMPTFLKWEYWGQLATIGIIGVLVLVPGIVLMSMGLEVAWIPVLSVACSASLMLREHYRRLTVLSISQWWTVAWFVSLTVTAGAGLYGFY